MHPLYEKANNLTDEVIAVAQLDACALPMFSCWRGGDDNRNRTQTLRRLRPMPKPEATIS